MFFLDHESQSIPMVIIMFNYEQVVTRLVERMSEVIGIRPR